MSLIKRVSALIGVHRYTVELHHCCSCEHPAAVVFRDGKLIARGHALGNELDRVVQESLAPEVYNKLNGKLEEDVN